jgi:hypothetical protein
MSARRPLFMNLTAGELAELADALNRSLSDADPAALPAAWGFELSLLVADVVGAQRAARMRDAIEMEAAR